MKKGWQTKKLGDLLEVQNGYAFSSKDYSASGHFVMRIGNVQDGYVSLSDPKFINLNGNQKLQRFVLSEGDILVSLTGNVGRVGVIQKEHLPAVLNQRVARIAIDKSCPATREFVLFFLYSHRFRKELMGAGHGAAQQNVSTKDLAEIQLPIPPLPEQQRIVCILDEAFEGIATAKANTEKNLQNARAIFESHLQSVFTQRGEAWVDAKLADVCHKITDGTHTTPTYTKEGIPFLSVKNLTHGFIDFSDTRFISPAEHEFLTRRCKPVRDDILYTKVGTTGIAQVVDVDEEFSIFVSVALLKPKHEVVFNFYLEHFLNAPYAREQAKKRTRGMANKNLVITDIKEIDIHFPKALDEQRTIVTKLESLSAETERLESIYRQKLAALEALKRSLLHQAFSGQL